MKVEWKRNGNEMEVGRNWFGNGIEMEWKWNEDGNRKKVCY